MEEFTGVTCPNCPLGHQALKAVEDANPGRVAAIGIQAYGNPQTNPVVDKGGVNTMHDNRTQIGTDLQDNIFGSTGGFGIPCAGIDRMPSSGSVLFYGRGAWSGAVATRLSTPTKANITVTPSYTASSRLAIIRVHVAYTSTISAPQTLNVALVENDVIDAQEMPVGSPAEVVQNYVHQHVLRDLLTPSIGKEILHGVSIAPGQVYERTFVYNVNAAWNPDNLRVVAFVSNYNGNDKEVLQAAEAPLK